MGTVTGMRMQLDPIGPNQRGLLGPLVQGGLLADAFALHVVVAKNVRTAHSFAYLRSPAIAFYLCGC